MGRFVLRKIVFGAVAVVIGLLMLAACGSGSKNSSPAVVGVLWQWNGLEETHPASLSAVPDPENYLLTLNKDGTFEAKADCNRVSGQYTLSGSSLTFALGPTTLAACPPHSLSDTYIHLLGQVASYGLQQGQLRLDLKNNTGSMFFHAA
jgi:heat shock protein HslJ